MTSKNERPLLDTTSWEPGPGRERGQPVRRFFKLSLIGALLVAVGLMPGAVAGVATTSAVIDAWNSQPNELPSVQLPGRTKVYIGGKQVAEVFSINRVPVAQSRQGQTIRDAVVAIEDARFFRHGGIDPIGTARALVSNRSGVVQGGSTITQQLAKNVRMTQAVIDGGGEATPEALEAATARSWQRKVAEAHLAVLMESRLTKDQILTEYLNIAYFGAGAYGIQAAAMRYFSVPAAQLSIPQAAMLAGILQSPVALDPRSNPTGAKSRRSQVLNAMLREKMISPAQATAANATPIRLKTSQPSQGCSTANQNWAAVCDAAIRELKTATWLPPQARSLVATGGLRVDLSVDPKTQIAVNEAASDIIPSTHRVANAITMVEPTTGYIKALGSNRGFGEKAGQTEIPLNTTRSFAPASTFKIFTLVAALERGIPLSTTLPGGEEYFSSVFDNPPGGYHNAEGLTRYNVTIPEATEWSVNTAFVQLMEKTGVAAVADVARRLGVKIGPAGSKTGPGIKEGSFTLGARDVSVAEMAGAYAAIANHGRFCQPTVIKSVVTPDGTRYQNSEDRRCRDAVDPAVADTVASVLRGVIEQGTGKPANIGRPAAGKTGTGEDAGSAWFAGFTPQVAAAVWTGDPTSPQNTLHDVLGYSTVYGGTLPADLWRSGMRAYLDDLPVEDLPGVDPGYLLAPGAPQADNVVMPDLRGLPIAIATATLEERGLRVEVVSGESNAGSWVAPGVVVDQSANPGAGVRQGATIRLTVAD